ncbi:MAG: hypothetical protein ACQ5SW_08205, partial [Sphaerochaetaceae bacterium]
MKRKLHCPSFSVLRERLRSYRYFSLSVLVVTMIPSASTTASMVVGPRMVAEMVFTSFNEEHLT